MNKHNKKIGLVTAVMLMMIALPMATVSAQDNPVDIGDSGFGPMTDGNMSISMNDTVTFSNTGTSPTTITSADMTTCSTGEIAVSSSAVCTFAAEGTFVLTSSAGSHTLNVSVVDDGSGGGDPGSDHPFGGLDHSAVATVKLDRASATSDSEVVTVSTLMTWSGSGADSLRAMLDDSSLNGDGDGTVQADELPTNAAATNADLENPVLPVRTGSGAQDPDGADLGASDTASEVWAGMEGLVSGGPDITFTATYSWNLLDTDDTWGEYMRISVGFGGNEGETYAYGGSVTGLDGDNRTVQQCKDSTDTDMTDCSATFAVGDAYSGYSFGWDIPRDTTPFPDEDNDGVHDDVDECKTVPDDQTDSTANSTHGCPDTDQDGMHDGEDTCPSTHNPDYAIDSVGCDVTPTTTDTDGDGWNDNVDQCPGVSGTHSGCPDTDGDGVHDGADQCPADAATTDEDGDGCEDASTVVMHSVHVTWGSDSAMGNVSDGTTLAAALTALGAPALGSSGDALAADDPRHGTYTMCETVTVAGESTCAAITDDTAAINDEMHLVMTSTNSSGDATVHVVAAANDMTAAQGDWLYFSAHTACADADGDGTCENATATFTSLKITSGDDLNLILTPGNDDMKVTVGEADTTTDTTTTTTDTTDTAAADDGALPGFGLVIGLTATLGAALIAARRD